MEGSTNQISDFNPKPDDIHQFMLTRYEDISNEARHNAKANSTIYTLFIVASFSLTAYFFTQNPENQLSFILIIISLFWFAMFYNISWNMANEIVLKLRDKIVIKYGLNIFKDYEYKGRVTPSHIFTPFALGYHLIFTYYSYINLPLIDTAILLAYFVVMFLLYTYFINLEQKIKNDIKNRE